jgi:uncharacterized membrane protein YhaH (DUF805 family)
MTTNKKLWFVNKTYGWGWVPSSWEGWAVLVFYIAFNFWNFFRLNADVPEPSTEIIVLFLVETFIATIVMLSICYYKGEKPEWRWGKKQ